MRDQVVLQITKEYEAIDECVKTLDVGESIFCDKNIEMILTSLEIKNYLGRLSINKKCYVLIESQNVYEIARLPDGADYNFVYHAMASPLAINENRDKLIKIIDRYKERPFGLIGEMDKAINREMKNQNIVTYAYLQRSTATVASFKRQVIGATKTLHALILDLIEDGKLIELSKSDSSKHFDRTARMFKINK